MKEDRLLKAPHRAYVVFGSLSALDVIACATSEQLRDVLGSTESTFPTSLIFRLVPGLALVVFYGWFVLRGARFSPFGLSAVRLHSIAFSLLGAAATLPWVGVFAAIITPISVIYFSSILWLPSGYMVARAFALMFAAANVALGLGTLRSGSEPRLR